MTELTKIANKCGTDKGTVAYEAHGYTEEYFKYIPNTGDYALIEIGVWHCDSMRMWKEYNPDMRIIGVDIDVNTPKYMKRDDDYALFIGDATKSDFVDKIIDFLDDEPDFIIDDGSHRYEDILAAFKLFYPKLKKGGYYFIEDLHAAHAQRTRLIGDIYDVLAEIDPDHESLGLHCDRKLWVIKKG